MPTADPAAMIVAPRVRAPIKERAVEPHVVAGADPVVAVRVGGQQGH